MPKIQKSKNPKTKPSLDRDYLKLEVGIFLGLGFGGWELFGI
jgi:hypothetical protein